MKAVFVCYGAAVIVSYFLLQLWSPPAIIKNGVGQKAPSPLAPSESPIAGSVAPSVPRKVRDFGEADAVAGQISQFSGEEIVRFLSVSDAIDGVVSVLLMEAARARVQTVKETVSVASKNNHEKYLAAFAETLEESEYLEFFSSVEPSASRLKMAITAFRYLPASSRSNAIFLVDPLPQAWKNAALTGCMIGALEKGELATISELRAKYELSALRIPDLEFQQIPFETVSQIALMTFLPLTARELALKESARLSPAATVELYLANPTAFSIYGYHSISSGLTQVTDASQLEGLWRSKSLRGELDRDFLRHKLEPALVTAWLPDNLTLIREVFSEPHSKAQLVALGESIAGAAKEKMSAKDQQNLLARLRRELPKSAVAEVESGFRKCGMEVDDEEAAK
jgi:hypothetical protein